MPSSTNHQTSEQSQKQSKAKNKITQAPKSTGMTPETGMPLPLAIENPDMATPEAVVRLQRKAGNQAVNRWLDSRSSNQVRSFGSVQFKLSVGPAGDKYEQEAEQTADRVMRMPSVNPTPYADPIQREMGLEEEEKPDVQREFELHGQGAVDGDEGGNSSDNTGGTGGNGGTGNGDGKPTGQPTIRRMTAPIHRGAIQRSPAPIQREGEPQRPADPREGFEAGSSVEHEISARSGGGKPLPESTRNFMEPRFGADLSKVNIHTGPSASNLNQKLSAQAFTHGTDIFFGAGKYNPGTASGNHLLAHELTHVVQQGGASPLRRKVRRKYATTADKRVQRVLSAESSRAFDTAANASAKYGDGRKIVNKFVTPVAEPQDGARPPWQTMVSAELADDNVTTEEQDKINNTGRTHGIKFWKKSEEQEKKLKDFVRAFMLWDFASRTNQLRSQPGAKYATLPAPKKAAKRKAYMTHAQPFQEKFKGLVSKGPTAPETQVFLQQEGFLGAMGITDKQQEDNKTIGPRIDVRSTFIGGPILGINLRAHLFIVYTGRDGKQIYFRGGPGQRLDPNVVAPNGFTTADYGDYTADTVDYDPSAPSVTVLRGDEAEAKLDAMIEASKAVNAMRVPYVAQVETSSQKKFKNSWFAKKFPGAGGAIDTGLGALSNKGENCNRAAWTILTRAGVPTNKPIGKHPGWGAILGADTPGKENAQPGAETDAPSENKKITLDEKREIPDRDNMIPVYVDRMLFQKKDSLPVGTEVRQLADGGTYRKIKYGDDKIGYVAKRPSDMKRTLRMKMKAALEKNGWYTEDEIDKLVDEINNQRLGRLLTLLVDMNMDTDLESRNSAIKALSSVIQDFGKTPQKNFTRRLDAMSEGEIRNLKTDFHEFWGMITETGVDAEYATAQVDQRVGVFDRHNKLMGVVAEYMTDVQQISLWLNHHPEYTTLKAITKDAEEDQDYVIDELDAMRPEAVQGHFITDIFDRLDYEKLKIAARNVEGNADWFAKNAEYLGVPTEFFVKRLKERFEKKQTKRKLEKAERESEDLEGMENGYDPEDYPAGKQKITLPVAKDFMSATQLEGTANIPLHCDSNVGMVRVTVVDEWTIQYGRARVEHDGKSGYVDLAAIFGPPKSAKKKEEAPKSTSPFEGMLTPPEGKIIDFFTFGDTLDIDKPTRIKIIDEDYKTRDEWAHTFIMTEDRQAGNVYAKELWAHFKSDAEASTGGDKTDEEVQDKAEGEKGSSEKSPTELYKAGKYDWPWNEPVTFKVARMIKTAPMDEEFTFLPTGKFKQVQLTDELTLAGRVMLWYNGNLFYVALEDVFGKPEAQDDDLDSLIEDEPKDEPDLDDQLEDDEPEEDTDELPIKQAGISILEAGADLQSLIYSDFTDSDRLKKLNPKQLEKLAKLMGKSVEEVKEEIDELI